MWHLYIFSILAGLFAANGIPQFIKGGVGQKHQTPFGKSSSAIVNVCWGWSNLVIGAIFLHFAHVRAHELRAFVLLALSGLAMTLLNTLAWSKR
jgi:hypothetical protein